MKTIGEILAEEWATKDDIEFEDTEAERQFDERRQRIVDAVNLEEPDRVPIHQGVGFFSLKYAGVSLKEVMYDYGKANEAWKKNIGDFEWDCANVPLTLSGPAFETLDVNHIRWPGHGVDDDSNQYQYVEPGQEFDGEVQYEPLQPEEYQDLIDDPSDFVFRTMLPRKWGSAEALSHSFPLQLAAFHIGDPLFLATPGLADAFQAIADAAEECAEWLGYLVELDQELKSMGFPVLTMSVTYAPFDFIGDFLRGTEGILTDIHRHPEKVKEACERVLPMMKKVGIAGAQGTGNPIVGIYLHKGIFLRPEHFEEFYWPTLKDLILGLVENGVVPYIYSEGDYTPYLEIIRDDLPAETAIWHIEQDIFEAKEILGDQFPLTGGLKATPLARETEANVREYYEEHTRELAEGGGFIFAEDVPLYESKPENLQAAMETIREQGIY